MPKVCVIPGDGIGPEVVNEALKVLDVVEAVYEPHIDLEILPYGADHYLETGETLPPGELERMAARVAAREIDPYAAVAEITSRATAGRVPPRPGSIAPDPPDQDPAQPE